MPTTVLPEVGGRKLLPDNVGGSGEDGGPHGQLEADGMVQRQVGVDHVVAGDACDAADTQPHQDLPSVLDDSSFGQTWEQIISNMRPFDEILLLLPVVPLVYM